MARGTVGEKERPRASHALIGVAGDLERRMRTRLQEEHGYSGLRPSLGPFLSLIWLEARSLSQLAQSLAVSKQACSQLAAFALKAGFIARRSAVGPARGQVVALSVRGRVLVEDAIRILREAEIDYEERIGEARFEPLIAAVGSLHRSLEVQPFLDAPRAAAIAPRLGGLPQLAVELQRRLIVATAAFGHRGLKPAQGLVLPLIGPGGTRVRDLARRHRVSRQSISVAGLELESLGYLRRTPDPEDRRGTILKRTKRGDRLLADADEAAAELDGRLAAALGDASFRALQQSAGLLFESLLGRDDPEASVGGSRLRLRVVGAAPATSSIELDSDLVRLAASLRQRLGEQEAERLGALLIADRHAAPALASGRREGSARR